MPTLVEGVLSSAKDKYKRPLYSFFNTPLPIYSDNSDIIDIVTKYKDFFSIVQQEQLNDSSRLLLESIRTAWLKEINSKLQLKFQTARHNDTEEVGCFTKFGQKIVSPLARLLCLITFLGGITKYVSDTADSFASTIVPLLGGGAVPVFILVALAAIFVALAIAVYIAFDFAAIREKLGVGSIKRTRIDELAEQKDQLVLIQQSLLFYCGRHKKDEVKEMSKDLLRALIALHENLEEEQIEYRKKLANPKLKVTQYIINSLLSLMYAANGFFICQTGMPLIIAALNYLIPTLAITAPIPGVMLAFAILGALAAFVAFWCMEGQALGNFIANSQFFGYADVDKVNALYGSDLEREKSELELILVSLEEPGQSSSSTIFPQAANTAALDEFYDEQPTLSVGNM